MINPTAVILSSVMMLRYLGLYDEAASIEHAVFVTRDPVCSPATSWATIGDADQQVHGDVLRQPR